MPDISRVRKEPLPFLLPPSEWVRASGDNVWQRRQVPPGGGFWENFPVGLLPPHLHGGISSSQFVPLVPGKERRENAETESDEPASQPSLGFLLPE